MVESQEEKIIRLTKLGETCRKIIEGEITLFTKLTEEDYEFSIGRFIKTKETIIQKRMIDSKNFHLDFNLDNNKQIIWDMLFLSEVISRQITDPNTIKEILTKMMNVNLFGETYNEETLTQEENDKLKKSIVIYQKTRDSMSHNSTGISSKIDKETNKTIINNTHKNSIFKCEIPFQYIEKFGNGIIPTEEHKEIANEIDEITSNIFFKLGFEMKEIPNFFYEIHPSVLKRILEKVNGDINKLKELPENFFYISYDKKKLEYIFKITKGEPEKLKAFPYFIYNKGIKPERIKLILALLNGDIFKLKNVPYSIFTEKCSFERLTFLLKKVNLDVEKLQYFPEAMINEKYCSNERIEYLIEKTNNDLKKLEKVSYALIKSDNEKIEYLLKKEQGNFEGVTKWQDFIFSEKCKIERIEYLLTKVKYIESLKKMPEFLFNEELKEEIIDKIFNNKNKKNEKLLKRMNPYATKTNIDNIKYLLEKSNYNLEKIKRLPITIYTNDCNIERIEYLIQKFGGRVENLKRIPNIFYYKKFKQERLDYLIKITNGDKSKLEELPEAFFYDECSEKRIEYILNMIDNDYKKLSHIYAYITEYPDSFESDDNWLEYIINKLNKNVEILSYEETPHNIFFSNLCNKERIEYILSIVNENLKNLNKFPNIMFSEQCTKERIDNILNKINGNLDKLKEMPKELFTCNDDIFEELYNTHEMNMIKSIFGIGDEKLITLMIYMNAVFSNYQEEIENKPVDISKINIEKISKKIIDKSILLEKKVEESNEKKNNLKKVTIKQEVKSTIGSTIGAIKQIPTEDKLQKDITEINNEFIRLIGNSSRHFRIYKQDENTIVLEDYTRDKQGNIKLAFRATSTIEELFNITSSLVSNNINNEVTEEIVEKINISNKDKYTKEQLEIINQEYEKTKIELVKKILIQICLNKKQITNIRETKEDNIINFEYKQPNGTKIKRDLEDLYQYFKNIETDIFNEAIEEYNNYLKEKNIQEIANIQNNNIKTKKLNKI